MPQTDIQGYRFREATSTIRRLVREQNSVLVKKLELGSQLPEEYIQDIYANTFFKFISNITSIDIGEISYFGNTADEIRRALQNSHAFPSDSSQLVVPELLNMPDEVAEAFLQLLDLCDACCISINQNLVLNVEELIIKLDMPVYQNALTLLCKYTHPEIANPEVVAQELVLALVNLDKSGQITSLLNYNSSNRYLEFVQKHRQARSILHKFSNMFCASAYQLLVNCISDEKNEHLSIDSLLDITTEAFLFSLRVGYGDTVSPHVLFRLEHRFLDYISSSFIDVYDLAPLIPYLRESAESILNSQSYVRDVDLLLNQFRTSHFSHILDQNKGVLEGLFALGETDDVYNELVNEYAIMQKHINYLRQLTTQEWEKREVFIGNLYLNHSSFEKPWGQGLDVKTNCVAESAVISYFSFIWERLTPNTDIPGEFLIKKIHN